jgi:Mn2+/Fe2+ NRAMP family transporter
MIGREMSLGPAFSSHSITIVIDDNKALGIASAILSYFIPIVALPMAVVALRRSKRIGQENFWARIGRDWSIFALAVYFAIMAIGLTTSVIIPLMRG